MYCSAPWIPPRRRASGSSAAVTMNTGISDRSRRLPALSSSRTAQPSVPGMRTSRNNASGGSWRTLASASSPSAAVTTRCPACSRLIRTSSRMSGSSSTTRTRAIAGHVIRRRSGHAGEPLLRPRELVHRRERLRTAPGGIARVGAAGAHDLGDERFPDLVLTELRLEPEQLVQDAGDASTASACLEHARHAFLTRDVRLAELVHDAVAMTLEQRHERLHLGEHTALLA